MKILDKITGGMSFISKIFSCVALFGMMVLISVDVALRLFADSSITGSYDMVQMVMSIVVFAAFVCTQRDREMIHATFLLGKLPGKLKYIVWSLGYIVSTCISGGIATGTLIHAISVMKSHSATNTIRIPMYPFYFGAAFFMYLLTFVMIVETIKTVIAIFSEKYAKEMRSQWTA